MTGRRSVVPVIALIVSVVLALTGCLPGKGGGGSGGGSVSTGPITFTWGLEQQFTAYNLNTPAGNLPGNLVVLNQVLPGFWQYAPNGTIMPNTAFGTFQKVADAPLTVTYTFDPRATWSDGVPLGCDDAVLTWMANSGVTGAAGFASANGAFYQNMAKPPVCAVGARSFTVVYKKPFADWMAVFGPGSILPAHVVEKQAGMTKTFVDYAATPTSKDLARAISFYNTGWQLAAGQLKKNVMPSSGPFWFSEWRAGQSLTLRANPAWWGAKPKAAALVLRFLAPNAQAAALINGDIDAMDPDPQIDLVNQLTRAKGSVRYYPEDQYAFEQLSFNVRSSPFKDLNLRRAFALCVPRQQIVDNLVKPQNASAQIMDSRLVYPFQPEYKDFAADSGGKQYDATNSVLAKSLLQKAGKVGMVVRLGWKKDPKALNQRRADTVSLIQASCGSVGFKVEDAGSPDFMTKGLVDGSYDVALYAWAGSPLVSSTDGVYTTNGAYNLSGYSNPQVDQLSAQLNQEVDRTKQLRLMQQIDTQLWRDVATIPLFVFPGLLATSPAAVGVQYNPTQADLSWNAYDWNLTR